ncbi:hypothetical protein K461DRAFT_110135 [Myriangium duriaei CBS 260.36]|uniref:Vacuolar protein sorting-associated protein 51 homolog n=1 Tax=Myriangium duriaei CBS 260.36 TaxID=1168546 RepID=A0A9P4JA38_9PEZI|nr:hypothetical protein K461DRAFT_110135 [Myriangium duriaei CBS 260.36]
MTTIASPRPSLTLSSRRTSTSTDTNVRSESVSHAPGPANQRRNRAALREFYGLKNAPKNDAVSSSDTLPAEELNTPRGEIDRQGFDADQYVDEILDREGLEGVMKVEAGLLRDIRGFDGERKALVYDNYSKLIGATETIRKMRGSMDPLKPAFTTLTPAISHIAEQAKSLSSANDTGADELSRHARKEHERQTVQYVLDAPSRLQKLVDEGRSQAAHADWGKVSTLLDKWDGVAGVVEIRQQCTGLIERIDGT